MSDGSSSFFLAFPPQCAALVGEDQPLCPDLPELDLSELDVSDLDADSFLGGLKWYSDQSEIISAQYGNEASNLFEVSLFSAPLWPLLLSVSVVQRFWVSKSGVWNDRACFHTPMCKCAATTSLQTGYSSAPKSNWGDNVRCDKLTRTFVPVFRS